MNVIAKNSFFLKNAIDDDFIFENSEKRKYSCHVLTTYILLKIQHQDWVVGEKIFSENYLAVKFNCSKSIVHNALVNLKLSGVLKSVPFKLWIVDDFNHNFSILNIGNLNLPYNVFSDQDQEWFEETVDINHDLKIFFKLNESNVLIDFSQMYHFKKVFFNPEINKPVCTIRFAVLKKFIYKWNYDLASNDLLKLLAINGQVIKKRTKNIVVNYSILNKEENFELKSMPISTYNLFYNQDNDLIMISKQDKHIFDQEYIYQHKWVL